MTAEAPLPVGTLLQASVGRDRMPLARMAGIDPRNAAAQALAAYLKAAVFCIPGPPEARFKLNDVVTEWPENFKDLHYPAAAITSATVTNDAHSLTPTCLEETAGVFERDTVLWKTSEMGIRFQVDFWLTNKPERQAIAAAIQELFAPTEGRYGVMVQGPASYYDRAVRLTLAEHERVDSADAVTSRDRSLRVLIVGDIDVVQLRRVKQLEPRVRLAEEPLELEPTDPT